MAANSRELELVEKRLTVRQRMLAAIAAKTGGLLGALVTADAMPIARALAPVSRRLNPHRPQFTKRSGGIRAAPISVRGRRAHGLRTNVRSDGTALDSATERARVYMHAHARRRHDAALALDLREAA